MIAPQRNKLGMFYTVIRVCKGASTVWTGLPALATNFTAFEGMAETISNLAAAQSAPRGGTKKQKDLAQRALIAGTMVAAGALRAYAVTTNNRELEGRVSFTRSDLLNLRDAEIDDQAEIVRDLLTTHLAALSTFGVAAATVDALTGQIEAYAALVGSPRTAQVKGKTTTQAIADMFERADRVLKGVIDPLMLQFEESAPTFFADYQNARVIVDRPGGHGGGKPGAGEPKA